MNVYTMTVDGMTRFYFKAESDEIAEQIRFNWTRYHSYQRAKVLAERRDDIDQSLVCSNPVWLDSFRD